ncbi:MAG: SPOR domain-containing protein [Sphingobacteriales bacterium JAD_PAG50586_3]|nr:MAG: SPOR domain-containing protein [Sphingobacteriales bacterium JAD_PAG50586_3]
MKCSACIPIRPFRQVLTFLLVTFIALFWQNMPVNAGTQSCKFISPPDSLDTITVGSVTIIQSKELSQLVKNQVAHNKALKDVSGFRIQIFSENGPNAKADAATARQNFNNKFTGIEAYMTYKQPYFKICVGDFKTQLDARTALLGILKTYPNAIIVRERVEP